VGAELSTKLPVDGALPHQAQPWLLHSLSVNALNFCAFALCDESAQGHSTTEPPEQLIASPNGLDAGGIDIFHLPSEHRISQIHSGQETDTATGGMVMAVSLFRHVESRLVLLSGYEDGRVKVHSHQGDLTRNSSNSSWQTIMTSQPHSQPVLSLDVLPSKEYFITSGADAILAKFPLTFSAETAAKPDKVVNTKHAGQQSLSVRSDGKIFATAGWDGRLRVYSVKTMKELAVLKWHTLGCYATAIANVFPVSGTGTGTNSASGLQTDMSMSKSTGVAASFTALEVIRRQREEKARFTHWVAGGGKDGKISLWDIY
jgi:WD40 repeat protein